LKSVPTIIALDVNRHRRHVIIRARTFTRSA
jgi:hypothetical protein